MKKLITNLKVLMTLLLLCGVSSAWAEKITDIANIKSGKTYYIGASTGTPKTDFYLFVAGNLTGTGIAGTAKSSKAEATKFTFTASGDNWTIQFENGNYLYLQNAKDNGKVGVSETAQEWTLSNDTKNNLIKMLFGTTYCLQKNNSTTNFGSYGNTQTNVWLEEATDGFGLSTAVTPTGAGTIVLEKSIMLQGQTTTATFTPNKHFTFNNWSIAGNGALLDDATANPVTVTMGTADATITANCTEDPKYNIVYKANGGIGDDITVAEYAGENVTILYCTFEKEGYAFTKWNTKADGTGVAYAANDVYVMTEEGITLYAQWEETTAETLTFDFTSEIDGWAHKKADGIAGNFTYTLDDKDYVFSLSKNGDGIYQTTYKEASYLMINNGEELGLPTIPGYKLTKVAATNTSGCSTSVEVSITDGTNELVGGIAQIWTKTNSTYVYILPNTYTNSKYYLVPSKKNAQIASLALTFEQVDVREVNVGPSGYATYSSENYTVIPDPESGVQLFGAKINDEGTAVTLIPTAEGQAIGLKGEGFIVKATPNTTVYIEQTGENGGSIEGNQLVGTVHSEYDLTQGEAYLLSATSDGTPFFGLCKAGTLAANKAFLPVPSSGVKAILAIEEGGTTGINTIKNVELNIQDAIYNLAGQKVGADYKGIVIRNGKKMLNK